MGTDEHGPAYPEPPSRYRCPVCDWDEQAYLRCNHPGCPDGHDPGHPTARRWATLRETYPTEEELCRPLVPGWAALVIFVATLLVCLWLGKAHAMDHGFDPNNATVKWFESLQRPDQPGSCCGKGDGYPVGDYVENPDGSVDATISDGSAKLYPDGTTRNYFQTGAVVHVPKEVVNPLHDDLDNPTDTSWIFMTVHAGEVGVVYCLIRHPSGN